MEGLGCPAVNLDRRFSGDVSFRPKFPNISTVPFATAAGYVKFHVFVDTCSIEVFVNDGQRVLTSLIFPNPDNRAIELFSSNGPTTLRGLTAWPLSAAH
jgi:sucrose-6-phosphate hydrolase SacC (GH32 family)